MPKVQRICSTHAPVLSLESLLLGPGHSPTSQTMKTTSVSLLFGSSFHTTRLMPRHGVPISRERLHFVWSDLKLELNQIQQSCIRIPGIIGVCTGIAYPSQILSNQPKSINTGREIAGCHPAMAAIHMHEVHGPDSLAESGTAVRGTSFRNSAVPTPWQCCYKPQSVLSQVCGNKENFLDCPHVTKACKDFDGLLPLKKWVRCRNIGLQ